MINHLVNPLRALLILTLLLGVLAGQESRVRADEPTPTATATPEPEVPRLAIRPSAGETSPYVTLTLEPGEKQKIPVELVNAGKQDVIAITYRADAFSLINGGMGIKLLDEPISGPTEWVQYETEEVELEGESLIERTATVTVPKDTAPGEYLTALVIQNRDVVEGKGEVAINQILRHGMAIAITVPGDLAPGLALGDPMYVKAGLGGSLRVQVKNTGNMHLKPAGEVTVVDADGVELQRTTVTMDTVYAGMETWVEVGFAASLAVGDYSASVTLIDPKTGASAVAEALAFSVTQDQAPESETTGPTIDSLTVTPVRPSEDGPVTYADVAVTISNPSLPIPSTRLTLTVMRDGELVEEYVLSDGQTLQGGPSQVAQRYIPASGWVAGTYTFSVTLYSIDPATGDSQPVATAEADEVVIQ